MFTFRSQPTDVIVRPQGSSKLVGAFIQRGGEQVHKSSLGDVKVKISTIADGEHIGAWSGTWVSGADMEALIKRAVGDDFMVSANDLGPTLAQASGLDKKIINLLLKRIQVQAAIVARKSLIEQAIDHATLRHKAATDDLQIIRQNARDNFHDAERLRAIQGDTSGKANAQAVSAIAKLFPDNPTIAGLVAALGKESTGIETGIATRIAALPKAQRYIERCRAEAAALTDEQRERIVKVATDAIAGGWALRRVPFDGRTIGASYVSTELAPTAVITQLAQRGEIFVSHPNYPETVTQEPIHSLAELVTFLVARS